MPQVQQPSRQRQERHPLFRETNAVSKSMPVPHPELWETMLHPPGSESSNNCGDNKESFWDAAKRNLLAPPNKKFSKQHGRGMLLKDARVQFGNPEIGARQLLQQCGVIIDENEPSNNLPSPEATMAQNESIRHLADVLAYFQTVAAAHHAEKNSNVECNARIVSTIGSIGTKCPRWHADHVPVRLVMSVLGPGCEYIPENNASDTITTTTIVNRHALNNLEEDDTKKANDIIVPPQLLEESFPIVYAEEGDAVLLMGRGWEDNVDTTTKSTIPVASTTSLLEKENEGKNDDEKSASGIYKHVFEKSGASSLGKVLAAVHRSPTMLPDQKRILLTVDLVDW